MHDTFKLKVAAVGFNVAALGSRTNRGRLGSQLPPHFVRINAVMENERFLYTRASYLELRFPDLPNGKK